MNRGPETWSTNEVNTREEFKEGFALHKDEFFAKAFSLTKNRSKAEDLMQDVYYKVYKNANKYESKTNFKAWVYRIIYNTFVSEYRTQKNKTMKLRNWKEIWAILHGATRTTNTWESWLYYQELMAKVNSLEDIHRVPFLMMYQWYKYQEIADILGRPIWTIKNQIFFARKKLEMMVNK